MDPLENSFFFFPVNLFCFNIYCEATMLSEVEDRVV